MSELLNEDHDDGLDVVDEDHYTFRVDNVDEQKITEFFVKYRDDYPRVWIFDEISDKKKKQHMQGLVVFDRNLTTKEVNKHRKRISAFFDRKGGEMSFTKVKDVVGYMTYIVKQKKVAYQIGFTDEEVQHWYKLNKESQEEYEVKKAKRNLDRKSKQPMEILWEFYEPFYLQDFEHAKKNQVNPDYGHTDFLNSRFDLPRHLGKYVMIYYGEHAHKSFMINKMVEAASYLKYRVLNKYSKQHYDEFVECGSRTIADRMMF